MRQFEVFTAESLTSIIIATLNIYKMCDMREFFIVQTRNAVTYEEKLMIQILYTELSIVCLKLYSTIQVFNITHQRT